MDSERFDRLTKRLATGANRRGILKGLVGGAAAVAAGGLTRQPAAALHDPHEQCRHVIGQFCSNTEPAPGHTCCSPNYECSSATGNGNCQCAPHYFDCDGECIHEDHCCPSGGGTTCGHDQECVNNTCECAQEGFAECDGQCISDEHCCASDNHAPFDVCEDDEECVNGSCERECVPLDGECNKFHPCCHPEELVCSSNTEKPGRCKRQDQCVAVDKPCNKFHPCCHSEEYTCSSKTQKPGRCKRNQSECVAVDKPCNKFHPCCHPEEYTCSSKTDKEGSCKRKDDGTCDETKNTLCAADGFTSKCCPGLHRPCNRHNDHTFDCGIKTKGGVKKQSVKKGRKR